MSDEEQRAKRDLALNVLRQAFRQASDLCPASAIWLSLSAFIAEYGYAGISAIANALRKS